MKKLAAFFLAASLVGCATEGRRAQFPAQGELGAIGAYARPDYEAIFRGSDLGCSGCIVRDTFHKSPLPLQKGQSNLGETAAWNTADGTLQMILTAPAAIPTDTAGNPGVPSMGIFSTGHDFGPGSTISVSATFQKPSDTNTPKSWTVTVVARTGGTADTPDLKRLQLSFRVRSAAAELRVQEAWGPSEAEFAKLASRAVPQNVYDQIFRMAQPFTLKLFVDRKTGTGKAIMIVGADTLPLDDFNMAHFTASSGEPFTTVGAALASTAPGATRAVEATHFEIWAH